MAGTHGVYRPVEAALAGVLAGPLPAVGAAEFISLTVRFREAP